MDRKEVRIEVDSGKDKLIKEYKEREEVVLDSTTTMVEVADMVGLKMNHLRANINKLKGTMCFFYSLVTVKKLA